MPADVAFALALGENPVRVWREYRQVTAQKLAETCGISLPFLSQVETGKRHPSAKVLVCLAQALDVTLDVLVSRTEE